MDAARINVYIDSANLHRASAELGFRIDYKKFRGWLRQKYNPTNVYLFIGLIPGKTKLYEHLQQCGFILIFKQTISVDGEVKGNCDAELVLKATSQFYEKEYDQCVLVTGDGDFGCLVEFLVEHKAMHSVIAPNKQKCSFLLRNKNTDLVFLNDLYHKFSERASP
ncbi:MAG: NYN domain-containing protein [Patescibacteria group bacterium]